MNPLQTPVLFLVFNRFETTKIVFEAIRQAKPPKLYIASDGARSHKDDEEVVVNSIRSYLLNSIDWDCQVIPLFRDNNLGCKVAVSSAIDWFFQNEEMGIILEDDCLPNQSFFWFCEELLLKYKNDSRVCHIGGVNFINMEDTNIAYDASYYFSSNTHIWGWASWRRAWQEYDVAMRDFPEFTKSNHFNNIEIGNRLYRRIIKNVFQNIYDGLVDTWDWQWVYAILKNHGLSIIPSKNLITNIGFDVEATHTTNPEDQFANLPSHKLHIQKHPLFILADKKKDALYFSKIVRTAFKTKVKQFLVKK